VNRAEFIARAAPWRAQTLRTREKVGVAPIHWLGPLVAGLALLVVHLFAGGSATLAQRVLGALIGIIAIGAAWRYVSRRLTHRLPLPEYALIQAYVFWGMPVVTGSLERRWFVTEAGVTRALIGCLLFILVAIIVTIPGAAAGRWAARALARFYPARLSPGAQIILPAWIVVAVAANAGVAGLLPASIRFPFLVVTSCFGLLLYVGLEHRHPGLTMLMVVSALLGVAGLLTGMIEAALLPIIGAAIIVFMKGGRIPARWIAVALLLFLLLNPAKHAYREAVWDSGESTWWSSESSGGGFTRFERMLEAWWSAMGEVWEKGVGATENTSVSLDRLNELSTVARAMDFTGRVVPFDRGRRWPLLFYSIVPRVFWPSKPDFTDEFNDRYNILFGLQSVRGVKTATGSFSIVADGYWNFGWAGIAVVGIVMGFWWGFAANLWYPGNWGLKWLALAFFSNYHSTYHLLEQLGPVPQTFLGVWLGAWAIAIVSEVFSAPNFMKRPSQ
jgi:hypothetical protein